MRTHTHQLITTALNSMVHSPDLVEGHESLVGRIAAVHVVYQSTKSQILWFGQLTSHIPSILLSLEDRVLPDCQEMVYSSLCLLLESCSSP